MSFRLLLLTNRYPVDAEDFASPFVHDFCVALRELDVELKVLTPRYPVDRPERDPWVERFDWSHSDRVLGKLSLWKPGDLSKVLRALLAGRKATRKLARRMRPDFILGLWALPSGWWAMRRAAEAGIPYGVWCLGTDVQVWGHRPLARGLIRRILRRSALLYADGMALRAETELLAQRECLFLPSLRRLERPSRESAHPLDDQPYVLYFGRLCRDKGVLDLLDAAAKLREQDRLQVVLAGTPDPDLDLDAAVRERDLQRRCRLLGPLGPAEQHVYMRHARAVVLPSHRDSIPLVLGEALQLGTPVICSDLPDFCELLTHYRVGTVFPRGDAQALARQLQSFSAPPNFSQEVTRFLQHFRPESAARQLVEDVTKLREGPARATHSLTPQEHVHA